MRQLQLPMGMPITVEIDDAGVTEADMARVFDYFRSIDATFSTYKENSEIARINRGELRPEAYSDNMRTILALSEQTRQETGGYFDIRILRCAQNDTSKPVAQSSTSQLVMLDPSGIVKGWAILQAATMLKEAGFQHFYIDAGGDIQVSGYKDGQPGRLWRIGIRNPFNRNAIVKVLAVTNKGIATSGTAIRGQHIYNPHDPGQQLLDVVSLTVIGPDVYEADRFATAAFAMGKKGISFIEELPGFEGYMIGATARATYTSGFERYVLQDDITR